MEIKRVGSQPFRERAIRVVHRQGTYRSSFSGPDPAFVQGASVTFEPGARTAWHTHPLGQTLIVIAGCGWAQREGGLVDPYRHSRKRLTARWSMWMEQVSDEQYRR